MKLLHAILKPIASYYVALKVFYARSFLVLFAKHPNLDGTINQFQMQKGIVWELGVQHWILIRTIGLSVWLTFVHILALVFRYLNLVFCLVLLVTAPLWTPFSLLWLYTNQSRLDKKFKAKAMKDISDL
jgi:hypothetical protein